MSAQAIRPGSVHPLTPRYEVTPEIEARVRQVYRQGNSTPGAVQRLAKELGWPRHAVYRIANVMNLQKRRPHLSDRRPWTEPAELELLETTAHLSARAASLRFRKAGYDRTAAAISNRRRVEGYLVTDEKIVRGLYSAGSLAALMGVDQRTVVRWISLRHLKATKVGNGYRIKEAAVKAFIRNHTVEVNFGRCDKYWLVDVLAGGPATGGGGHG